MNKIDYCSRDGAEVLASRIKRYWRSRGVTVKCRIVPLIVGDRTVSYDVRSNLTGYEPCTGYRRVA